MQEKLEKIPLRDNSVKNNLAMLLIFSFSSMMQRAMSLIWNENIELWNNMICNKRGSSLVYLFLKILPTIIVYKQVKNSKYQRILAYFVLKILHSKFPRVCGTFNKCQNLTFKINFLKCCPKRLETVDICTKSI